MENKQHLTIMQPMIDKDHKNVLWYSGDVATIEHAHSTLTLRANGDVDLTYEYNPNADPIRVRDRECQNVFFEKMKNYIPNDTILNALLQENAEDPDKPHPLHITDNNWWEVFIDNDGEEQTSIVLNSDCYDDALDEMIQLDKEMDKQRVFVYTQYQDDQPFTTCIVKVFSEEKDALACLKKNVEEVFGESWEEIKKQIDENDTMEPDYVSISNGDACRFFILNKYTVN